MTTRCGTSRRSPLIPHFLGFGWIRRKPITLRTLSTDIVVWVLTLRTVILTASVLFSNVTIKQITYVLVGEALVGLVASGALELRHHRQEDIVTMNDVPAEVSNQNTRRIPPLSPLHRSVRSTQQTIDITTLRGDFYIAVTTVINKIEMLFGPSYEGTADSSVHILIRPSKRAASLRCCSGDRLQTERASAKVRLASADWQALAHERDV